MTCKVGAASAPRRRAARCHGGARSAERTPIRAPSLAVLRRRLVSTCRFAAELERHDRACRGAGEISTPAAARCLPTVLRSVRHAANRPALGIVAVTSETTARRSQPDAPDDLLAAGDPIVDSHWDNGAPKLATLWRDGQVIGKRGWNDDSTLSHEYGLHSGLNHGP